MRTWCFKIKKHILELVKAYKFTKSLLKQSKVYILIVANTPSSLPTPRVGVVKI